MKAQKEKGEIEWYQILVINIAALEGFSSGAITSWSSPFMVKIIEDKEHYNITEEQASLFGVLHVVALIVLTPFFEPFLDIIGRKNGIILTSVPFIISWLIKAFFTNLWALYLARIIAGLGDALIMCVIPMYIGEVATPKVRGIWGCAFFILVIFGTFIINAVGIYCSVAMTSYIFLALQFIFLILTLFIPESPYFYIAKDRNEEAKKALRKLRRKSDVEEEFASIQYDVKRQLSESGTWKDLLFSKVNRRALIIATFLRMAQILSGVWVFGSYTHFMFQNISSNISAEASTLIYTGLNFVIYSLAIYGSSKLGRRRSLLTSLAGTTIVFLFVSIYFLISTYYPNVNLDNFRWFPLAGLIGFLLVSSFGVGPIPALMQGELFSTSIKSKGISLVVILYGAFTFITNSLFYYLYTWTGLSGPFILFGLSSFVSFVGTYFLVPETKGKTLEEIQQCLKND